MLSVLQWFLFGMFVWACCIAMQAFQQRFAPETGDEERPARRDRKRRERGDVSFMDWFGMGDGSETSNREQELEKEVVELRKRVETLEAIVTDRKYQWEQDLNS